MKVYTGADANLDEPNEHAFFVGMPKIGKTVFMVASALGLVPGQNGGVVATPEDLWVIGLDGAALGGIHSMLKALGAPPEAYNFKAFKLENEVRRSLATTAEKGYDTALFERMMECIDMYSQRASDTSVLLVSSFTTLAHAVEVGIGGTPKAKGTMDMSKWSSVAAHLGFIQARAHRTRGHVFWEGHLDRYQQKMQGQEEVTIEKMQGVAGKSGRLFANNVHHIFRVRRLFGECHEGTNIDRMYFDSSDEYEFVAGRNTTEKLDDKEFNLTRVLKKLGKSVGGWGYREKSKSKKSSK